MEPVLNDQVPQPIADPAPPSVIRTVCIFCGARKGADPMFAQVARAAGRALAARGLTMVFGGGGVGLMGEAADAALAAGGEVIGVIPQRLIDREAGHRGLSRLEVVADMAVRKDRMLALSDAFLVLPGGLGTLDELFEVLTLRQIGYHAKPTALVSTGGYYEPLLRTLRGFAGHGLVDPRDLDRLVVAPDVDGALTGLLAAV